MLPVAIPPPTPTLQVICNNKTDVPLPECVLNLPMRKLLHFVLHGRDVHGKQRLSCSSMMHKIESKTEVNIRKKKTQIFHLPQWTTMPQMQPAKKVMLL